MGFSRGGAGGMATTPIGAASASQSLQGNVTLSDEEI